jgi:hypothetical protein
VQIQRPSGDARRQFLGVLIIDETNNNEIITTIAYFADIKSTPPKTGSDTINKSGISAAILVAMLSLISIIFLISWSHKRDVTGYQPDIHPIAPSP